MIVGGTNVYPAEIEATLVEHPQVADIAVFGVPDPEWGQRIVAVLQPVESETIDIDEVKTFAGDRLARYKMPSQFDVVDALPREASGKLKKRLLRDQYVEA